jgi:hypothetical protein
MFNAVRLRPSDIMKQSALANQLAIDRLKNAFSDGAGQLGNRCTVGNNIAGTASLQKYIDILSECLWHLKNQDSLPYARSTLQQFEMIPLFFGKSNKLAARKPR